MDSYISIGKASEISVSSPCANIITRHKYIPWKFKISYTGHGPGSRRHEIYFSTKDVQVMEIFDNTISLFFNGRDKPIIITVANEQIAYDTVQYINSFEDLQGLKDFLKD